MAETNTDLSPSAVVSDESLSFTVSFDDSFSPILSFDDTFSLTALAAARTANIPTEEDKPEAWRSRWHSSYRWNHSAHVEPQSSFQAAKYRSTYTLVSLFNSVRDKIWPFCRQPDHKRQIFALLSLMMFGVIPFAVFAYLTKGFSGDDRVFNPWTQNYVSTGSLFSKKQEYCQAFFYNSKSPVSKVGGIRNIFVFDKTFFYPYSFQNVKIIDMSWDILVGRGVQLLASWTAYVVFTDVLLRVIELHSVSFKAFQMISLEGPSIPSLWVLIREAYALKSKRIYALFVYMLVSTIYILAIPPLLGGMTGYDTLNSLWFLPDGTTHQMLRVNGVGQSWILTGAGNQTFDKASCVENDFHLEVLTVQLSRKLQLCLMTLVRATVKYQKSQLLDGSGIYTNSSGKWTNEYSDPEHVSGPCSSTFNVSIKGITYDAGDLRFNFSRCFASIGYREEVFEKNLHRRPDTGGDNYVWGFSSVLSGNFIIVHLVWSLSMYIVWQDAQRNSTLIKNGYNMTRLRAAFAMTEATKQAMGLSGKELVRAKEKEVNRILHGTKTTRGTAVDHSIFSHNQEDMEISYRALKKQDSVQKQEEGFSEVTPT